MLTSAPKTEDVTLYTASFRVVMMLLFHVPQWSSWSTITQPIDAFSPSSALARASMLVAVRSCASMCASVPVFSWIAMDASSPATPAASFSHIVSASASGRSAAA
jgi:hypothetical protein